jgi:hypothetical protein
MRTLLEDFEINSKIDAWPVAQPGRGTRPAAA